jgi:hypothetical protein
MGKGDILAEMTEPKKSKEFKSDMKWAEMAARDLARRWAITCSDDGDAKAHNLLALAKRFRGYRK